MNYFEDPFAQQSSPEEIFLAKEAARDLIILTLEGRETLLRTIKGLKMGIFREVLWHLFCDETKRNDFVRQIRISGLPSWFIELLNAENVEASHLKCTEDLDTTGHFQDAANEHFYD